MYFQHEPEWKVTIIEEQFLLLLNFNRSLNLK